MADEIKILVIGGGFSGISAAYQLANLNNADGLKIPLFKDDNSKDDNSETPISSLLQQKDLTPVDANKGNEKIIITLVEKQKTLGGRIWSPADKRNGETKIIEMGGEFIDGNFSNTLYYCALLDFSLTTTPGWRSRDKAVIYADNFRINKNEVVSFDDLSKDTKVLLSEIENKIDSYGIEFIKNNIVLIKDSKYASDLIYVTDKEPKEDQKNEISPIKIFGQDMKISYRGYTVDKLIDKNIIKIKAIKDWKDIDINLDVNWKEISIQYWLEKIFDDKKSPDQILAKEIWLNSIAGEYGDPAQVGLAFLIHQAAIYNYNQISDPPLDEDKSLGLRESMRVETGNDAIAKQLGERLTAAGHIVQCGQRIDNIALKNEKIEALLEGKAELFDYAVISTPAIDYPQIMSVETLKALKLEHVGDINYGIHAKVAVSKKSSLDGIKKLIVDGSYWDSTPYETDNPQHCASQVWVEYPFLGSSNSMNESGWMTFYLTYRSQPHSKEKHETIETCINWANANTFKVGQYTSAGVGVAGSIELEFRPNRYHTGYAAYGPGEKNDKNYLNTWQVLINTNEKGIGQYPIVLAGEHTDSQYVGYMEGALRSGARAAQALALQIFKKIKQ